MMERQESPALANGRQNRYAPKSGGTRATQYYQAAINRLEDAEKLLKAGGYHCSTYIGGYVVEFQLKYVICVRHDILYLEDLEEKIDQNKLGPELKINIRGSAGHNLENLARLARLDEAISNDKEIRRAFAVANTWNVVMRYSSDLGTKDFAERFLEAVQTLKTWLITKT